MRLRTATLALLALSTAALAHEPGGKDDEHRAERMDRLATILELNDAQKSQVQAIFDEQRQKHEAMRAQAQASGEQPSREQMHQHREEMRKETQEKLRGVLTDEQMKKFEALGEEHRGRRHGATEGQPAESEQK
jgi:periplasmic protein CpxP/Spy